MALSITDIAIDIQEDLKWQRTPERITHVDYKNMVIRALKRLFIDTGRALQYDPMLLIADERGHIYDANFGIDEQRYIVICAEIEFFKRVQTDVNNIVGYSTDALTVTNSDKPYAHLQDTIGNLEQQRRQLYYRMTRYSIDYLGSGMNGFSGYGLEDSNAHHCHCCYGVGDKVWKQKTSQ